MNSTNRSDRGLLWLSRLLYILAAVALLAAVLLLIYSLGIESSVRSTFSMFGDTLGLVPIVNLIIPSVISALVSIALVLSGLLLALAVLLFTAGKLLARSLTLSERVERLETLVAQFQGRSPNTTDRLASNEP